MCSWSNTQNLELDKLDWELTNRQAEKHYSTPHSDHTLGTERGRAGRAYLFLSMCLKKLQKFFLLCFTKLKRQTCLSLV